jgi:glycosyltransferase involved in cell wall biosynthesis
MSKISLELPPEGVELLDCDDSGELAAAYGSAWATVLPAIGEAFGLVLAESLAAGTPAIALRSGASPEILADGAVGKLVEPGDLSALTEAMVAALAAPPDPDVSAECKRFAERFDWARVVALYEDFYALALAGGREAHAG